MSSHAPYTDPRKNSVCRACGSPVDPSTSEYGPAARWAAAGEASSSSARTADAIDRKSFTPSSLFLHQYRVAGLQQDVLFQVLPVEHFLVVEPEDLLLATLDADDGDLPVRELAQAAG